MEINYVPGLIKAKYIVDMVILKVNSFGEIYLENNEDEIYPPHGYVEAYQNGREQGYSLNIYNLPNKNRERSLYFHIAEHRNTDKIVIYWNNKNSMQGLDGMTEDEYIHQKFFTDEIDAAVDFIVDMLKRRLDIFKC